MVDGAIENCAGIYAGREVGSQLPTALTRWKVNCSHYFITSQLHTPASTCWPSSCLGKLIETSQIYSKRRGGCFLVRNARITKIRLHLLLLSATSKII